MVTTDVSATADESHSACMVLVSFRDSSLRQLTHQLNGSRFPQFFKSSRDSESMLLVEAQCRRIRRLLVWWNGVYHDPSEAEGLDVLAELFHQL